LAIRSEISEEQCLKRIPTWLEVEQFFLQTCVTPDATPKGGIVGCF